MSETIEDVYRQRIEYFKKHGSPKQLIRRSPKLERITQEEIEQLTIQNSVDDAIYLKDKDLSGLDMSGMLFHNAVFKNCDLSSANLRNANFTHALVDHCDMTDTIIEGACFWNAWMYHNEKCRVHSVDLVGEIGVKTSRLNYIENIDSVQGMGFIGTLDEFIEQAEQLADDWNDPCIPLVAEFFDSRRKMPRPSDK